MSPLLTTTVDRRSACAMACTEPMGCQSFSFRSGPLGCRIFPKRILAPDLNSSPLDVYFYKTWPSCLTWEGYDIVPGTSKCVLVSNETLTWRQAADACFSLGGHLLILEDADVMQKVLSFLPPVFKYFVGFNDLKKEDQFLWLDGTPVNRTMFYPGEPNDATNGGIEDCGLIMGSKPGLHDVECTRLERFVCSLPVLV